MCESESKVEMKPIGYDKKRKFGVTQVRMHRDRRESINKLQDKSLVCKMVQRVRTNQIKIGFKRVVRIRGRPGKGGDVGPIQPHSGDMGRL